MAATAASGSRLASLWKKGWKEIPEVMASSVLAVIGFGLGTWGLTIKMNTKPQEIMHNAYTVYRDDDPRAEPFKKTT